MWLRAFGAKLPRLRAAESMRRAVEIAIGSGVTDNATSRRIRSQWEREASGVPRRHSSPGEVRALAASFGFQFVEDKAE